MKSLIESILSSTKSGKNELVWDKYIDWLKSVKSEYDYGGIVYGTTYLPGVRTKTYIDKIFSFKVDKRKESKHDKELITFFKNNGYKSAIRTFQQYDVDLYDLKENIYYEVLEEHDSHYNNYMVFKIGDTIICQMKSSNFGYKSLYIYVLNDKLSTDLEKFEMIKKETGL